MNENPEVVWSVMHVCLFVCFFSNKPRYDLRIALSRWLGKLAMLLVAPFVFNDCKKKKKKKVWSVMHGRVTIVEL